tara:strand:+ start:525 stop:728 length:204 start_codon:yes stop_codon:yes gene_type:complete
MPRCKPTIIKVGDLVKVADWCWNKGLVGVVTRIRPYSGTQDVWVCFPGHDQEKYVQKNNLILLAEGK